MKRYVRQLFLRFFERLAFFDLQKKFLRSADFGVLQINPKLVLRCVATRPSKRRFVLCGNWDIESVAPISDARPYTVSTVNDMFLHGLDYRETWQYRIMTNAVSLYLQGDIKDPATRGGYWCKSHEDVDEYFRRLIQAYESIKLAGYKSQSELVAASSGNARKLSDEIRIFIGRDGEFILGTGGTHRVLIAQMLGVERVFVRLVGVHERFLDSYRAPSGVRVALLQDMGC